MDRKATADSKGLSFAASSQTSEASAAHTFTERDSAKVQACRQSEMVYVLGYILICISRILRTSLTEIFFHVTMLMDCISI